MAQTRQRPPPAAAAEGRVEERVHGRARVLVRLEELADLDADVGAHV